MRNLIFGSSIILLTLVFGLSCHKDDGPAPGFDMVYHSDFTIPAGIGVFDVHHFQLKNLPSDWQKYLDLHGKTAEDVTGVITAEASLGGIFGDTDLSTIDKISIRIYDESDPNDFVEIAYRDPAPLDSGNLLPLIPSLADSERFFSSPRFSMDVVIWLRRTTTVQEEVRVNLTMRATI